jgi:hypothetical protein
MKYLNVFIFTATATVMWLVAGSLADYQMIRLDAEGAFPYGPMPEKSAPSYTFNESSTSLMVKYPLYRINQISKDKFHSIVLNTLDPKDQENLKLNLPKILNVCEEYQLDPFWVLSIVMVESRFKTDVTSHKNARGLMQLRPDTAEHIYALMNKSNDANYAENESLYEVDHNLELGAFYLKKLLQNFRMDFKHATIAYNVGPNRLKNLLANEDIDPNENEYYSKVLRNHYRFTKNYETIISMIPEINSKNKIVKK